MTPRQAASSLVTRFIVVGLFLMILGSIASYYRITGFLREDLLQSAAASQQAMADQVARSTDARMDERRRLLERLAASLPAPLPAQADRLRTWLIAQHALPLPFSSGLLVVDLQGRITARAPSSATFPRGLTSDPGWHASVQVPAAEALATVERTQAFLVRLTLTRSLLVLLVVGLMIAWLLRPLYRAAKLADRMTQGELPLRPLLVDRLVQALARAKRNRARVALLFLDLDGFKVINDTHGHEAGDEALRQVACRLSELVRQADTLARLGGDEFVLLTPDIEDPVAGPVRVLAVTAPYPISTGSQSATRPNAPSRRRTSV